MITRPQAAAAADLIRTIAPSWDAQATTNAILELAETRPFRDIVWAAITQASDPTNRGPATLRFAGNHWPNHGNSNGTSDQQRQADRDAQAAAQQVARLCPDCNDLGYIRGTGARCPHDGLSHGERVTIARIRAEKARARIRPAPRRTDRDPDTPTLEDTP